VQIIELVTGNPKTVNSTGGAAGTSSEPAPAFPAGVPLAAEAPAVGAESPAAGGDAGCAFKLTAKTAAKNAQANMIVPNRFTYISPFSPHGLPVWANRIAGLKG